jgi:hypothetical protein
MAMMSLFRTTTSAESPLDASAGAPGKPAVSDFLTVQSFANFAAMTGAITAAWEALQRLTPHAAALWVPYAFAFAWAAISLLGSLEGLRTNGALKPATVATAVFVGFVNALVLAGAVVGTHAALA